MCYPHIRKLRTMYLQIACKIHSFSEFVLVRLGKVRPGKISGSAAGVPELNAHPHIYIYIYINIYIHIYIAYCPVAFQ